MTPRLRVALVGPIYQENLALAYLRAVTERAGHQATVIAYSRRAEIDVAVKAVLAFEPQVVGLGIAFQNNIDDYLAFLSELRARGFRGHLTAGGHVPTFCYQELLRDAPGLDSVVRHDGEETFTEILAAVARGDVPRDLPGLVWRDGDRVAAGPVRAALADLDQLPVAARSPEPFSVGGAVVDFVLTARGCVGECHYCSIAAYTEAQQKRFRLRSPERVADEIAALYRERNARVMFVQDDLFVLPSEKRTVERVGALKAALAERGVHDLAFWVKARPETVTPAVCEALRRMGAIHVFLGVESASAERLAYLGRTHLPLHNDSAIALCRAHDIVPSFNFMLFDPDASLDDVAVTLDMAEQHLDLPWNVCRTEVYSGTALRTRLAEEGRLRGDYRSFGYVMRDARAEVMFRIARVSLHERALAMESLLNRLISLSFARQIHEHFFPGPATDALSREVIALGRAVRADTLAALRQALEVAERSPESAQRFAVQQALELGRRDLAWRARTERLWRHLTARGTLLMGRRGLGAPARVRSGWEIATGS